VGDVFEVLVDLVLDPALMVGPPAALVLPGERILDVLEPLDVVGVAVQEARGGYRRERRARRARRPPR
jgi:hypothetical protein